MSTNMYRDDILKRMEGLDEEVDLVFDDLSNDFRFHIIIVGGGVLVLRDYLERSTDDIDLLDVDNRLCSIIEKYDMNSKVNAHIYSFLYNYEDRAELIWSGKRIDYFTASLEDIVISKICGGRDRDLEDLKKLADKVDWELLDKLANDEDELKLISMSDRGYLDFKASYKNFERTYRPCNN